MADHLHRQGEWMVGYRFMRTYQDEPRDGTLNRPGIPADFIRAGQRSVCYGLLAGRMVVVGYGFYPVSTGC